MGFSTISALIDHVRARVDHSGLTDPELLIMVNDGQRRLRREYPLPFFQSRQTGTISVASPQTFLIPSDAQTLSRLYVYPSGEATLVQGITYFTALEQYSGATGEQVPSRWSQYGTVGYLFPPLTSAAQYEVYYQAAPAEFSSVTASNALLANLPEALEWSTVGEYHLSTGELKLSEQYFRKAADSIKALLREGEWAEESRMSAIPTTPGALRRRR